MSNSVKEMLAAANASVPRISPQEAAVLIGNGNILMVDVRDGHELQSTGKVQGDYAFKLDYRQIGIGSLDPNTSDSDFAFGKLNQEGWKFSATYNIADFANLTATYFYTEAIQDKMTNAIANLDHSQTLQIDLNVKF